MLMVSISIAIVDTHSVHPNLPVFENLLLKRIDYNLIIIRRWRIKLMSVKSCTRLLSTFKV